MQRYGFFTGKHHFTRPAVLSRLTGILFGLSWPSLGLTTNPLIIIDL